jgi:hypothetical protein
MATLEEIVEQLESLAPASLDELACYVEYLLWKQGTSSGDAQGRPWAFDFVEHFHQAAISASHGSSGMEVHVGEASSGGESRMALWQHPPVQGSALVEYQVPVPEGVQNLRLHIATGIRDGSQLSSGNVVAFRVFVNGWRLWGDTQHARQWKTHEIALPVISGDVVRVQFATDGLGNHQWAWAAWGEPRLLGEIRTL